MLILLWLALVPPLIRYREPVGPVRPSGQRPKAVAPVRENGQPRPAVASRRRPDSSRSLHRAEAPRARRQPKRLDRPPGRV